LHGWTLDFDDFSTTDNIADRDISEKDRSDAKAACMEAFSAFSAASFFSYQLFQPWRVPKLSGWQLTSICLGQLLLATVSRQHQRPGNWLPAVSWVESDVYMTVDLTTETVVSSVDVQMEQVTRVSIEDLTPTHGGFR
jgi:hypothetical protein